MTSNPSFDKETGALQVAETYASQCANKIVLVTGVSIGGLGEATARALAHGGASTVIITGRNDAKLAEARNAIASDYPKSTIRPLKLDLSSFASIKKAAQEILSDEKIPHLDILIHNAGGHALENKRLETSNGIEVHFGGNHIGPFYLTNLLLPKLRVAAEKNAPGATRIVILTSLGMIASPVRFTDYQYERHSTDVPDDEKPVGWPVLSRMFGGATPDPPFYLHDIAYGASKTANCLHAVQLNRLFNREGIRAFSVSPGFAHSTGVKNAMPRFSEDIVANFGFLKSIDQGASTTLVAALDPVLDPEEVVVLHDCQKAGPEVPAYATDRDAAERLWKLSEEIVAERSGM
ncbi:retinol dehydrogenase 12 [Massarina eburnea CBS 473.64]|uniref:Retinol dehydrogenase 12 n=1 Tax=Massarina eburnea CBS 473.64 TaxID=1395130 RepID=A0A6A6RKH8_9PLEO|nr:retinol dehydrogenase 12 [Massarina eburnea CBS 473.64]